MASVLRALRQLHLYVSHTRRYLVEYHGNLYLEASYGEGENPDWYLSTECRREFDQYRDLLGQALEGLVQRATTLSRPQLTKWIKKRRRNLGRAHVSQFPMENASQDAERELLDVFQGLLRDRLHISARYENWNNFRNNRWYHDPFIPDPGVADGNCYWITSQTKFVLIDEVFQLRWQDGRVLFEGKYADITKIDRFWRRRKEHWRISLRDGRDLIMSVDFVGNLDDMRQELAQRFDSEVAGILVK